VAEFGLQSLQISQQGIHPRCENGSTEEGQCKISAILKRAKGLK